MTKTLRYRNLLIIYDREDIQAQAIFRQRIFFDDNLEKTPVTQKLLDRAIATSFYPRVRPFKPRQIISLQFNEFNVDNTSRFRVISPYLPGSEDFKQHAKQVLSLDSSQCISYIGEDRR